jgi:hypothetical protein
MEHNNENATDLFRHSRLYRVFLAERGEILRHKWLESEKAGYDIGFGRALVDWKTGSLNTGLADSIVEDRILFRLIRAKGYEWN